MNIVFKFGEHIYQSGLSLPWWQLLLTFVGALLGFGTALFIYYKREKSDKNWSREKEKEKAQALLKYNKLLFQNIIENIENQITALNEFIEKQEESLIDNVPIKTIGTNDFKRLISINADIFTSLNIINKNNSQWVNNLKDLHLQTDYVEYLMSDLYRISTNHSERLYNRLLKVKSKVDSIPNELSNYAFDYSQNKQEKNNEIEVLTRKYINEYQKYVEYGIEKINKSFLEPLIADSLSPMIEESSNDYMHDPIIKKVVFLAKDSRTEINDIKRDNENLIREMKKVIKELISSKNYINEHLKVLVK